MFVFHVAKSFTPLNCQQSPLVWLARETKISENLFLSQEWASNPRIRRYCDLNAAPYTTRPSFFYSNLSKTLSNFPSRDYFCLFCLLQKFLGFKIANTCIKCGWLRGLNSQKNPFFDRSGLRTHVSENTASRKQRLRPLGHAAVSLML